MSQAILFGIIGGSSLFLGALFGVYFNFKKRTTAAFMAFGSGVLICALTFGLMEEAFNHGGFDAVITGFLAGSIVFISGDYLLHLWGGRRHRKVVLVEAEEESSGSVITLGAILDGVPESIALGVALVGGGKSGILMLAAIFLSNFPESISSIKGLKHEGYSKRAIFMIWGVTGLVVAFVTVLGFIFLGDLSPNSTGVIEAFAAGAILAMLADSMMPEAYEYGGVSIGILTVLGFLTAFIISRV